MARNIDSAMGGEAYYWLDLLASLIVMCVEVMAILVVVLRLVESALTDRFLMENLFWDMPGLLLKPIG